MKRTCPNKTCASPDFIIRDGTFRRIEDAKNIQRFRCKNCGRRFSAASFSQNYWQKRRRINLPLLKLLSSGVSLRRSAILLGVNRKTVERKLPLLAYRCRRLNSAHLEALKERIHQIQLDDLITKENSKLKPLSVTIAVDEDRRLILAAEVSQIPSFGHLAKLAQKNMVREQMSILKDSRDFFKKSNRLFLKRFGSSRMSISAIRVLFRRTFRKQSIYNLKVSAAVSPDRGNLKKFSLIRFLL